MVALPGSEFEICALFTSKQFDGLLSRKCEFAIIRRP